ncbi:MAG: Hpt domain-containing protein [Verrucomicrobiota bacterium]|nr:Hpt domain-containing protein [Verrucomicrobiota bacterium]
MKTNIFDGKVFLERMMNDYDFAQTIAEDFFKDIPLQIQNLKDALNADDPKDVQLHAHSIKGIAATLSAQALSDLAFKFESLAKKNDLDLIRTNLNELEEHFLAAKKEINKFLETK